MACGEHQKLAEDLDEYQQRLANVLGAAAPETDDTPILALPPVRVLRVPTVELNIKINEFYALQDCPVATLIAQRNTSLGRTQLPSTRYAHEVSMISGLQDCAARTEDPAMQQQLQTWLAVKEDNLSANWVNLILTSEETRQAFGANTGFISGQASDNLATVEQAIKALFALDKAPSPDIVHIEEQLKHLADSPLPARMWRSQQVLAQSLRTSTGWLQAKTETLSCDSTGGKQQAEYLNNVFRLYFIGKIQPVAASLSRYHYAMADHWQALLTHPDVPADFIIYLSGQLEGFEHYQQQLRAHVLFWQDLLRRCGMSPSV